MGPRRRSRRTGQVRSDRDLHKQIPGPRLQAEVEEVGHDWPTNSAGFGWTRGRGYLTPVVEPDRGASTFHDVAVSYFEYQTRMMRLKPYTLHRYRRSYELHLTTTFGRMPFTEVQALDIEDWRVEQRDLPSTGKRIRNRHGRCSPS